MNKNTALGASEVTKNIIFKERCIRNFFCFIYRNVETKMCIIRH